MIWWQNCNTDTAAGCGAIYKSRPCLSILHFFIDFLFSSRFFDLFLMFCVNMCSFVFVCSCGNLFCWVENSLSWVECPGGGTPYIGRTGMCGLYGWVYFQCKICRKWVYFIICRPGFKDNSSKIAITRHKTVKNRQNSQLLLGVLNNRLISAKNHKKYAKYLSKNL